MHDAARSLSAAYRGCGGGVAMAIEGLLLSSIETGAESARRRRPRGRDARGVAEAGGRAVGAATVPVRSRAARYLCVVAAGDRQTGRARGGPRGSATAGRRRRRRRETTQRPSQNDCKTTRSRPPRRARGRGFFRPKSATFAAVGGCDVGVLGGQTPGVCETGVARRAASDAAARRGRRAHIRATMRGGRCVARRERRTAAAAAAAPEGYRLFLERCLTRDAPRIWRRRRRRRRWNSPRRTRTCSRMLTWRPPRRARAALRRARRRAHAPRRRETVRRARARRLRPAPAAAADASRELLPSREKAAPPRAAPTPASPIAAGECSTPCTAGSSTKTDGALRAAGYVAAAGGVGPGAWPSLELPPGAVADALAVFVAVAGCKNPTLAGTAAEAIGHVGFTGPPPAPRARPLEPFETEVEGGGETRRRRRRRPRGPWTW